MIIFVTSYEQYVYEAFGINVYGFIKKSELKNQLGEMFSSACNILLSKKNVVINGKYDSSNITEIRVQHVYCTLIMNDKKEHSIRTSIDKLEKELNEVGFLRIRRNTLINMSYVKKIKDNTVTLVNDNTYEISTRRVTLVKRRYREYCEIYGRFC